jgi:hypothetical protein
MIPVHEITSLVRKERSQRLNGFLPVQSGLPALMRRFHCYDMVQEPTITFLWKL